MAKDETIVIPNSGPMAANLRQMEPGSSGFIDPWCLVELQYIPKPIAPDLDSKTPPPPPPSPHSGQFYLFPHKPVFAEPEGDATMPVSRGADMAYSVDLTGLTLPNPPRLESFASIERGEFLACKVTGLEGALAPPTAVTTEPPAAVTEPPAGTTEPPAAKPSTKSVPVTSAPATKPA